MIRLRQTETFRKWERKLRDQKARAAIAARLFRLVNGLAGDVSPVGEGISELRIHYGPGCRVYFQPRGEEIIVLLCGGDKSSQDRDIKRPSGLPPNGKIRMVEKLYDYDPADALKSDEAVEVFLSDAFESGDARYIAQALGVVARAKGMTKIARETGLAREQLYKSLSENGNPTLETTLAVMKAIGFEMTGKRHAA